MAEEPVEPLEAEASTRHGCAAAVAAPHVEGPADADQERHPQSILLACHPQLLSRDPHAHEQEIRPRPRDRLHRFVWIAEVPVMGPHDPQTRQPFCEPCRCSGGDSEPPAQEKDPVAPRVGALEERLGEVDPAHPLPQRHSEQSRSPDHSNPIWRHEICLPVRAEKVLPSQTPQERDAVRRHHGVAAALGLEHRLRARDGLREGQVVKTNAEQGTSARAGVGRTLPRPAREP